MKDIFHSPADVKRERSYYHVLYYACTLVSRQIWYIVQHGYSIALSVSSLDQS